MTEETGTDLITLAGNAALAARIRDYQDKARGAMAANTEKALRADTAVFSAWCAGHGAEPLPAPPETVAAFIDAQAEAKAPATVRRYVASIAHLHRAAGVPDPTKGDHVRLAVKRMTRAKGTRQRQAPPITATERARMVASVGDRPIDFRNAALLAVAYDTMARRSELVALALADLAFAEDGTATAIIARGKGDQDGAGAVAYLAPDTVAMLRAWIEAAGIEDGPVFRAVSKGGQVGGPLSGRDVSRVFKRMAKAAHIEADVSGHSARVGVTQDMLAAGFGVAEIMQAGRWKSAAMPARYGENQMARRGAAAKLAALQNRA